MNIFAAVMTQIGTGAISTIQVFGDSAEVILKKIFTPIGKNAAQFEAGNILLGNICEPGCKDIIDQITLGCEGPDNFAISCHGNPLIVEMIMQLLQRCGAGLLTGEQLLAKILASQNPAGSIVIEAGLMMLKTKTIEGAQIIAHQAEAGLSKKASEWLQNIEAMSLKQLRAEVERILDSSTTAGLIIAGCKVSIVGPPNTGKSTLLNCLAGRQKAIVTNIKGTTRDWVSAECRMPPLVVELIDTAGLDEKLTVDHGDAIAKVSQRKSLQILRQADLVLLVLDISRPAERLDSGLIKKLSGKKVLTVLNKSDLPNRFDVTGLPEALKDVVRISAKFGAGIENMADAIRRITGVADFNLLQPVCFTSRQENLLRKLKTVQSKQQAVSVITELLTGHAYDE